jgi:hypothetical protein
MGLQILRPPEPAHADGVPQVPEEADRQLTPNTPKGRSDCAGLSDPTTSATPSTSEREVPVTTEITFPVTRPISEQGAAVEALAALIEMFGQLPGGYIKVHQPVLTIPAALGLQVDSPQAFEVWRAALGIAPSGVDLRAASDEYVWLQADGVFHGVAVHLTGFNVPLTADQANTPQVTDETSAVAV